MNIINSCKSDRFENLDKIDKFLTKYKMPELEQEEIEGLNTSIATEEAKIVSSTSFPKKLRPNAFVNK